MELGFTRRCSTSACVDPNYCSRVILRRARRRGRRRVEHSRRRRCPSCIPSPEQCPACSSVIVHPKRISDSNATERRCVDAPTASPWLGQSTAWRPTSETPDRTVVLTCANGHYGTAQEAFEKGSARTRVWAVGLGEPEIVGKRPESTPLSRPRAPQRQPFLTKPKKK